MLDEELYRRLVETRARRPEAIAEAGLARPRRPLLNDRGTLFLVAADHSARGVLRVGDRPTAMADRRDLLGRLLLALGRPGVDGVLATADIIDDLLLLRALDDKVAVGSMNRGGLSGTVFELDDRMTGYTVEGLVASRLDGGKMMVRIADDDYGTASTLESCGRAVTALAAAGMLALVETFATLRDDDGRLRLDEDPERTARAIAIASGLGATSAYTWLKVPVIPHIADVLAASTLPAVILGGDVDPSGDSRTAWPAALAVPTVRGIVAGRSMLYPHDGDVVCAVDSAVGLLMKAADARADSEAILTG